MPSVWIPALMRNLSQGQESVQVTGGTLREVIDALDAKFPGIRARLCDGDAIRPGLSVVIGGQISRSGLAETLNENSEVHFIPAIAGGSSFFLDHSSLVRGDARRYSCLRLPPMTTDQ